jgi:Putative beta barrel porin-7 (BBP7)
MANRWMGAALVCGWLAAAAVAHAQEPAPVGGSNCGEPIPGPLTTPYAPQGPPDCMSLPGNLPNASTLPGCGEPGPCCPVGYVSAEYLFWWLKRPSLPAPLVTGAPTGGTAVLGAPGTVILLDNGGLDYNPQSGGRVTAGIWFDPAHILALEGDGFLFERKPVQSNSFSDGGNLLGVPYVNALTAAPAVYLVADPTNTGGIAVATSNQFWGAESNVIINTHGCGTCDCGIGLSFLVGFRYLDFDERTTVATATTVDATGVTTLTNDQFRTRNEFYGGQIGTRVALNLCHFFFAGQAKIAFGEENEIIDERGTTTTVAPLAVPTSVPAGLFAVPSNAGRFNRDAFAYVPEVEARFGYQFTPHFSIWVGYTLLYWNEVLRSGQQIDPNIDPRQPPVLTPGVAGPVPGAVFPQVQFHETSLWAQGINFGMEFIY